MCACGNVTAAMGVFSKSVIHKKAGETGDVDATDDDGHRHRNDRVTGWLAD